MKKFMLFILIAISAISVSCSKSKTEKEENNFVTMTLHYFMTANPCTGYYCFSPEGAPVTSFKYNANENSSNSGIITTPVTVQISFHDLPDPCSIDLIYIA